MNTNERFDRLDTFIAEDRLVRKAWGDGQERACLLLALAPEVETVGVIERCPASVLPAWLAHLTPSMDDCGSEAAWPAMVRRYARVVRRGATTLDDVGWRLVLARTMLAVLAEAKPHDTSGLCARVSGLWVRVLADDEPREEEWEVAEAEAEAVKDRLAEMTAASAEMTAASAGWAAASAGWAAGSAWCVGCGRGGSDAPSWAAAEAAVGWAVEAAVGWAVDASEGWARMAAGEATWDCMTTAILDSIEVECDRELKEKP